MGHESATEKVGAKDSWLTDRSRDWEQAISARISGLPLASRGPGCGGLQHFICISALLRPDILLRLTVE
jgi:hypothetical protein